MRIPSRGRGPTSAARFREAHRLRELRELRAYALLAAVAFIVGVASCGGAGSTRAASGTGAGEGTGASANGGASASTTGTGGSLGSFATTTAGSGSSSSGACSAYKGDCAKQGFTCGNQDDGCGNILNCGTCATNESCGANGTCTTMCTPKTKCSTGANCGSETDGCSGVITCGGACPTGETCNQNVCGAGKCTPKTCASAGYVCGTQSDGCNGTISCGTCANDQTCGANGMTGQCVTTCTKTTCAALGATCGPQSDGCGGTLNCGSCGAGLECEGIPSTCKSTGVPCTGLCLQQQTCTNGATTSISGSVFAPNGTDVLPGALVYVPNAALEPFVDGVTVPHCACGDDVSGSPLVSAVTAFDGTFSISNMPVGTNIPLVIQKGRWRRVYTIPNVAACTNTVIPSTAGPTQLRMPQKEKEFGAFDNIPLQAFVTGSVDALECVLRKIGIADSQFSDPSGTGRVRFYLGDGGPGASYSKKTPVEDTLWGTQAEINAYDIVYFACQGDDYEKTAAQQQIVVDYANAGGRVFATHYSYVWITNDADNAVWSPTATWVPGLPTGEGAFATDPGVGLINTAATDPRPTLLAKWLQFIGASTTYGQMTVQTLRNDFTAVTSPSLLWIHDNDTGIPFIDPGLGDMPLHYTFDTPWNIAPANQCGRVLYSDFHVEDATDDPSQLFPSECVTSGMTPQEKMLEFMIFDLGSCVTPGTTCTPSTCAAENVTCGPVGDGCGNILQCGNCPSGESCIAGKCASTCTPLTHCPTGVVCGSVSDGCGNTLSCGSCPSGQCSNGKCGSGTCTPILNCPAGMNCGEISDGCSGTINCGTCTAPDTCGGGGTPNVCGAPPCTAKTCAEQGFNCGSATDGCGHVLSCGTCVAPQTCGGGSPGQANVCGGFSGT